MASARTVIWGINCLTVFSYCSLNVHKSVLITWLRSFLSQLWIVQQSWIQCIFYIQRRFSRTSWDPKCRSSWQRHSSRSDLRCALGHSLVSRPTIYWMPVVSYVLKEKEKKKVSCTFTSLILSLQFAFNWKFFIFIFL